jgi:hypothetical protein
MGCLLSTEFVVNDKSGQDEYAMILFEQLGLQKKEIDAFYRLFKVMDARQSGYISHDAMYFQYR